MASLVYGFLPYLLLNICWTAVTHLFLSNSNTQKAHSAPELTVFVTSAYHRQTTKLCCGSIHGRKKTFRDYLQNDMYDFYSLFGSCAIKNWKCSWTICAPCIWCILSWMSYSLTIILTTMKSWRWLQHTGSIHRQHTSVSQDFKNWSQLFF